MSRLSRLKKSNYNNVLYIKEKYKIVDDLEQISFLLNILQKEQVSLSVRLSRNIWCLYYSLLSPSSVWSESSLNRTKKFEFESSSEYSQGPGLCIHMYIHSMFLSL